MLSDIEQRNIVALARLLYDIEEDNMVMSECVENEKELEKAFYRWMVVYETLEDYIDKLAERMLSTDTEED